MLSSKIHTKIAFFALLLITGSGCSTMNKPSKTQINATKRKSKEIARADKAFNLFRGILHP